VVMVQEPIVQPEITTADKPKRSRAPRRSKSTPAVPADLDAGPGADQPQGDANPAQTGEKPPLAAEDAPQAVDEAASRKKPARPRRKPKGEDAPQPSQTPPVETASMELAEPANVVEKAIENIPEQPASAALGQVDPAAPEKPRKKGWWNLRS
jgi:ribonuclease E